MHRVATVIITSRNTMPQQFPRNWMIMP